MTKATKAEEVISKVSCPHCASPIGKPCTGRGSVWYPPVLDRPHKERYQAARNLKETQS